MTEFKLIQIALELWGALITLFCGIAVYVGRGSEVQRGKRLAQLLFVNAMLLFSDAVAWNYNHATGPETWLMVRLSNFLVFALIPIMAMIMAAYLTELVRVGGGQVDRVKMRMLNITGLVDLGIIVISQFTGLLYRFDENNVYQRSGGYMVCAILAAVMLFLLGAVVLDNRGKIWKYEVIAIFAYILMPFVSNIIQLAHYGISLNNITVTIAVLLVFLTDEIEKSRRLVENEKDLERQLRQLSEKDTELAEKRIQVSISQMQPHFVFNALGSIEQLCRIDPVKAANATHQFAQYLRSNLNALNSKEPVSFEEELQHIRTYVWLEKMRFDDDVVYEEDIQTANFMLPALSVQPLVENSIKYGMMAKEDGQLHVWLTATEDGDCYQIVIRDDGEGFDQDAVPESTRGHIGLANVQERIHLLAHGSMKIDSVIGAGTTVTIRIPKEVPQEVAEPA